MKQAGTTGLLESADKELKATVTNMSNNLEIGEYNEVSGKRKLKEASEICRTEKSRKSKIKNSLDGLN